MTQGDAEGWIRFMRQHGVRRLRVNELEIELDPVAVRQANDVAPAPVMSAFEDATGSLCACGHSWMTEHNESGCLLGCSHQQCGKQETLNA